MGYTLDNLSLMALSIAVGFVVDDAVVEIENIQRHIEEGLSPYDAAMKGSGEIGFTVVAITFSLIAVFIPLFLMSGYVGLLFREFAITVSVALLLSLVISRTLTPMMCAYLLKPESKEHGWLYRFSERGFDSLLNVYEAGLKIVLRHQFITLMVMFGTIALTGYLYVIIPKGFFPQQDTGLIIGQSEAAQDISFQAMTERQQAMLDAIVRDPAVASVAAATGAGGGLYTINDGRVFIQLKPKEQRGPIDQVIARLRTNLAKIQGITLYMQAAQDITIGARLNKTQFQYTMNDADPGELNHWTDLFLEKFKALHSVTDVATDQLNGGRCSTSRSSATSPRATASCPIRSTTRSTTRSASVSSPRSTPPCNNTMSFWRSTPNSSMGRRRSTASMSNRRADSRCRYPRWSIRL
jgi:HAE1 family hydrophobic/amphiphilic exporter-1